MFECVQVVIDTVDITLIKGLEVGIERHRVFLRPVVKAYAAKEDVLAQGFLAGKLRDAPLPDPSGKFHLEHPVLGVHITPREEQVFEGLCGNGGDGESV